MATDSFIYQICDDAIPPLCDTALVIVSVQIPLQVKWLSFDAIRKGMMTALFWSTAQELNNAGFVVENSNDGIFFEKIGEVSAGSSSEATHRYAFTDTKPFKGKNYYRIRQFDYDGNSDYSPIRILSFTGILSVVRVWPNPVNGVLNIQLPPEEIDKVTLTLYNSTGQIVLSRDYEARMLSGTIDVSHMDPGLYSLLVETQRRSYVEKIVIAK